MPLKIRIRSNFRYQLFLFVLAAVLLYPTGMLSAAPTATESLFTMVLCHQITQPKINAGLIIVTNIQYHFWWHTPRLTYCFCQKTIDACLTLDSMYLLNLSFGSKKTHRYFRSSTICTDSLTLKDAVRYSNVTLINI